MILRVGLADRGLPDIIFMREESASVSAERVGTPSFSSNFRFISLAPFRKSVNRLLLCCQSKFRFFFLELEQNVYNRFISFESFQSLSNL